ncbi:hypothetical protein FTV88_2308 [Heliorestis convoluta]|uniref:Uncharacterized protein n=1 Tax=Heliorestis convoluta TaxID=356322 RepID=A0A5Q2N480_9FIRM|nr:hypothetical protein FTV88_2308 [Heliorestis convoluta]
MLLFANPIKKKQRQRILQNLRKSDKLCRTFACWLRRYVGQNIIP